MKAEPGPRAVWPALAATAAGLLVVQLLLTQPYPSSLDRWDGLGYRALSLWQPGEFVAPFSYRLLTPLAAGLLGRAAGLSLAAAYRIWNATGLLATLLALLWLIRLRGVRPWAAGLAVAALAWSFPVRKGIAMVASTDPWSYFFMTVALGLLLERRFPLYAAVMALGALNRESQVFVALTHIVFCLVRRGRYPARGLVWELPGAVALALVRLLLPVQGSTFGELYFDAAWIGAVIRVQGGPVGIALAAFAVFGELWILAGWRSLGRDEPALAFWTLCACGALSSVFANNTQRLFAFALPALALQLARGLERSGPVLASVVAAGAAARGYVEAASILRLRLDWMLQVEAWMWRVWALLVLLALVLAAGRRVAPDVEAPVRPGGAGRRPADR